MSLDMREAPQGELRGLDAGYQPGFTHRERVPHMDDLAGINAFLETGDTTGLALTAPVRPKTPKGPQILPELRPEHRALLLNAAISEEVIASSGIVSTTSGLRFPWNDGNAPVLWQTKPDQPVADSDGRLIKYVFPKNSTPPLNRLRDGESYERVILVEGTKQQYAVLSHAPAEYAVYGMSGCWGWRNADLSMTENKDVFILLDGDIETNTQVYSAAEKLAVALKREGASTARFVMTTAKDKEGIDDVLAAYAEERRPHALKRWLMQATEKLPKRPKGRRRDDHGSPDPMRFFYQSDAPVKFNPTDMANDLLPKYPAALTAENTIAMYSGGRYQVDELAFLSVMVKELDYLFTPGHAATAEKYFQGLLHDAGRRLPEHSEYRLLNCRNGMVDLATGKLLPHDPKYMSTVQIPVSWNPEATAPTYEAWLKACCGTQMDDLEEVAGTMLDPTRPPSKAIFLFGPSRSGKSTFLRILKAMAGQANISAVTLHQLADDKFAAANCYGKILNVAADLSSRHVEDLSLFKMILGEDEVQANRKYGAQFSYTNQALFAFSANELPTVSESSSAYTERMKPFEFPNSFAGREDIKLWDKLRAELPGILVRWVKAYQRFTERGGYAPTDARVRARFERSSDRVVQFVGEMCEIIPASHGDQVKADCCTGRRQLAQAFNNWAERNGGHKMGERKIFDRLRNMQGIVEVRDPRRGRAFNLVVKKDAEDDRWEDEDGNDDPFGGGGGNGPQDAPQTPSPSPAKPDMEPAVTDDSQASDLRDSCDSDVTEAVTHVAAGVDPLAAITGVGHAVSETVTPDPVDAFLSVTPDLEEAEEVSDLRDSCDSDVTEAVTRPEIRFPEGLAAELSGQVLGFDIETGSAKELYSWDAEENGPYMVLGGVIAEDGTKYQTSDAAELIEVLYRASEIYGHNILNFDIPALVFQHGGDYDRLTAHAVDTRTLAVLDEPPLSRGGTKQDAYDLDAVAEKLGLPGKTDDVKRLAEKHGGFHLIPLEELSPYLDGDLIATKAVRDDLVAKLK